MGAEQPVPSGQGFGGAEIVPLPLCHPSLRHLASPPSRPLLLALAALSSYSLMTLIPSLSHSQPTRWRGGRADRGRVCRAPPSAGDAELPELQEREEDEGDDGQG